jgi:hypothetical protein
MAPKTEGRVESKPGVEAELARQVRRLAEVSERLHRERCLLMVGSTKRYLWYRFLGGIASGVGSAIGATVVFAIVLLILQHFNYPEENIGLSCLWKASYTYFERFWHLNISLS